MNNYWHTNYKADQDGPVTFRYAVRPHGAFRAADAARFGAEAREPLLVVPAAGPAPSGQPLLVVAPAEVLVTALRPGPDGRSWLVSLYNPGPEEQRVTLAWRTGLRVSLSRSDSSGRGGAAIRGPFVLPPAGTAVLRAEPR
jgi:alpha-mannosidase